MRAELLSIVAACVLGCAALARTTLAIAADRDHGGVQRITWEDTAPLRTRLEARGLTSVSFASYIERVRRSNARRVREGDLDHLVFYLLQSTRFTPLPPIEPALSAKALVDSLDAREREMFLRDSQAAISRIPPPVRSRVTALMRAFDSPAADPPSRAALPPSREAPADRHPPTRDAPADRRPPSRKASADRRSLGEGGSLGGGGSLGDGGRRGLAAASAEADPRLAYFRELVTSTFPVRRERETALLREYLRVMRFVYEKEFVAQRSARGPEAVAELYRGRGLSTDTAVEAGYLVHLGLAVVKSLEPDRRVRRVLIVGPGLDLAPRTALREMGPPESYQPWAVIDALLALGLSQAGDLDVVAADINPRVVEHLRRSEREPPTLTLVSEIRDSDTVTLSAEYRDYFAQLGRAVGKVDAAAASMDGAKGHLHRTVQIHPAAARALRAETLDIVTERLERPAFDLVVATNVLPYFDDAELMLAMSNVARMLAPGGIFLHNEARPLLRDVTAALGLPFEQSRHAIIATVRGAPAPLFDSVWLHRSRFPQPER